jgi:hypothetical protein
MRLRDLFFVAILSTSVLIWAQAAPLHNAGAVLERYKEALGGVEAIKSVQSETTRGEIEGTGLQGKATFVSYSKAFRSLFKVTLPDGREIDSGFDGTVSWSVTPQGASIDKDTPLESARRDADLQYALHQPDYFKKLEFAGVTDFEGHRCYWLHGTTHWAKTIINSMTSKRVCWSGTAFRQTLDPRSSIRWHSVITRNTAAGSLPRSW